MSIPESNDALWQSYRETIVEITRDDAVLNDRQVYEIWKSDFYMITAANPFSRRLTDEENETRNLELHALLIDDKQEILVGIGRDSACTWVEKGWVLCGVEDELILLAKKFEQNAIFKFTSAGREIIDCR